MKPGMDAKAANANAANQDQQRGAGERQHSPFSPHQSHSVLNNYFGKKGPIKPPTQTDQASAIAIQNMIMQTA